jgi:5-deoxy-glucuronate isomerase
MTPHDTRFRSGFPDGHTAITREGEAEGDTGIDFGIWRGRTLDEAHEKETVWLLLDGAASIEWPGGRAELSRRSVFDEAPSALSVPAGTRVRIDGASEWAVARATNERRFEPRLFRPADLSPEYRGKGLVQDASLRNVRLIFDYSVRPESNLVIGEVVNYPGRWSSYPPHHHVQPEIYHYRFTHPQGYGHSELGDKVMKVRGGDTVRILDGVSHAQVSAPGYAMYYIWIVRHLAGNPYKGFHYSPEHEWVLDPRQQGWRPAEGP